MLSAVDLRIHQIKWSILYPVPSVPPEIATLIAEYVAPFEMEDYQKLLNVSTNVVEKLEWIIRYPDQQIYLWQVMDAHKYKEKIVGLAGLAQTLRFWETYRRDELKCLLKKCYFWCWDQIVVQMERNPRILCPAYFENELLDLEEY